VQGVGDLDQALHDRDGGVGVIDGILEDPPVLDGGQVGEGLLQVGALGRPPVPGGRCRP
jgi:hypothetical protein